MNDKATLALQIDRLMRRFHSDLHPNAQRVDQEKIGPIGGMVLFMISESGTATAQTIGSSLGRDKSQVSRIVSLLVRKGFVEKFVDDKDARSFQLGLTDKGKLQVAAFNGALVATTNKLLGHLSKDEARQFSKLLSKILD
ncbi:MAG: MarR family winged helix-turn-helix transcriptional regulator [Pseudomonadota bacterium]